MGGHWEGGRRLAVVSARLLSGLHYKIAYVSDFIGRNKSHDPSQLNYKGNSERPTWQCYCGAVLGAMLVEFLHT